MSSGILTPSDEFQYWQDLARSFAKGNQREVAESYCELFSPISKDFGGLDAMPLLDGLQLVEVTQDTLDDVWKQSQPPYPEERMKQLLTVIGEMLPSPVT